MKLVYLMVDKNAPKKVDTTLTKIVKQAAFSSNYEGDEFPIFFVTSKNAAVSSKFFSTQINFLALSSFLKYGEYSKIGLTEENISHYANYFLGKAIGSNCLCSIVTSLRALDLLKDQMFLTNTAANHLVYDNSVSKLSYNVVNAFGEPVKANQVAKLDLKQIGSTKVDKKIVP